MNAGGGEVFWSHMVVHHEPGACGGLRGILHRAETPHAVVLGDFNNLLFEGALKAFKEAGMKSIWHGLSINTDSISTHRHIESGNESGVIDHIFYRSTKNKVKVTNGGVIEKAYNSAEQEIEMDRYKKEWLKYGKPLSDHRPIWAEFTFIHD